MAFKDQVDGIETVLPDSREKVRIRSINMSAFLSSGRIMDIGTQMVARMLEGSANLTQNDDLSLWRDFYALQDEICRHTLVHPRVVDDPAEADGINTITIDMLSQSDKQALSAVLQAPVRSLAKLFRRQADAMELMDAEPELPVETVGDTPDPEMGTGAVRD